MLTYGGEVWQLTTKYIDKLLATELDFYRQYESMFPGDLSIFLEMAGWTMS